jgi:hypothetical protein
MDLRQIKALKRYLLCVYLFARGPQRFKVYQVFLEAAAQFHDETDFIILCAATHFTHIPDVHSHLCIIMGGEWF